MQCSAHGVLVRHRLRRVGAGDPQRLDLAAAHLFEQFDGAQPGAGRELFDTPVGGHFSTVFGIGGFTMPGQQVRQTAGFPTAHGIGLTGQGERSCAGTANLSGGQMQIDQRAVFGAASGRLIQPHAPQGQKTLRGTDPFGALAQLFDADPTQLRNHRRRVVVYQMLEFHQTLGVRFDEVVVDPVFPQQQVQNPMEQSDVGSRQNRQMQVSQITGIGAARVDDDDFHLRAAGFGLLQATKQHRMGVGHIAADDHHAIAGFQVFVAAGRCVGAEAAFVAHHR